MSDGLKRAPWLPSQLGLSQGEAVSFAEGEQSTCDELAEDKVTPPGEMVIAPRFFPVRRDATNGAGATPTGGVMISPRLSLKQRGDITPFLRGQFAKSRYPNSDLYVSISGKGGFGSDLVDTQEIVAIGLAGSGKGAGQLTSQDGRQGQPTKAVQSEISGAASNAAVIGVGNIAGNVLKYGNNLLIQRNFGAGPYGLYALGMSMVGLFVSVFNLGLDDAMVRYVSIYRSKKQGALLRGLAFFCSLLAGVAGILGALIMLLFAPSLAVIQNAKDAAAVFPILLLMAPLIPLSSMQAIWSSGMQGLKAFKSRILLQRLLIPGSLTLLLVVVLVYVHDMTAVVIAVIITTALSAVLNLVLFSRMVARFMDSGSIRFELREWLGFALPNFLTSVIDTVLDATDTLLLAFLVVSAPALGQYAAAYKISNFISMPLLTLNVTFAPTIAELFSKGEHEKLALMFQVVTKWIISFSLPLCLICILFSQPLLAISGKSFEAAWPMLIALAVGNMMNTGTGPVGYMLLMTGHQRLSFINSLAAFTVNIVLGIILTTRYGAIGTAIATGLALTTVNLMRLLQVRLLLKIQPYGPATIKPIIAGLVSALLIGALLELLSSMHASLQLFHKNVPLQLGLVPVFLACYAGLIVLLRVGPEDKIVLDKLRKKFGGGKKRRQA